MATKIEAYMPDLDRIIEQSLDHTPKILDPEEYDELLAGYPRLHRGAKLSDISILRCMELGLIKIWDPKQENLNFLMDQMQPSSLDLRLDNGFWHWRDHQNSRLTLGLHRQAIEELSLLSYTYKLDGDEFVFHHGDSKMVMALTQENLALSNVIECYVEGRSTLARMGVSVQQTAGTFEPAFAGPMLLEISNTGSSDIAIKVGDGVATARFALLDEPSTRPRTQKTFSLSKADNQNSPFGYWDPEWDREQQNVKAHGMNPRRHDYSITGDPAHKLSDNDRIRLDYGIYT